MANLPDPNTPSKPENMMAIFGRHFVDTQIISENDAVNYKLSLRGSNHNSNPNRPWVMINDKTINTTGYIRGFNVIVFDPATLAVIDQKGFDSFGSGSPAADAMVTYMNSLNPNHIACIVTYDAIRANYNLITWFLTHGSTVDFTPLDKFYRTSYAGIYMPKYGKVIMENFQFTAASAGDTSVDIEMVFDDLSDFGVTGMPNIITCEMNEVTGSGPRLVSYPPGALTGDIKTFYSLADNGIKPGDWLYVACDLYTPKASFDQGGRCMIQPTFRNESNSTTGSVQYKSTVADTWESIEKYIQVPAGTTRIAIFVYGHTTANLEASIKNLVMTQCTRDETITGPMAIGVNGIRNSGVDSVTSSPVTRLLGLPAGHAEGQKPASGIIQGNDFGEISR